MVRPTPAWCGLSRRGIRGLHRDEADPSLVGGKALFEEVVIAIADDHTDRLVARLRAGDNVIPARSLPRGAGFGVAPEYQNPRTVQVQVRFSV